MSGTLKNSDGSAEWHSGLSPQMIRMICAVNGPIEAKLRDELPSQATLELVYRRNVGLPMIREQLIQDRLYTALLAVVRRDLMPRSLVQVVVQLLESWNEPADLALAAEISEGINCMSLALTNAGIPLKGLLVAQSYYIDANEAIQQTIVYPTAEVKSTHALAFTYINDEINDLVMVESSGEFTKDQLFEVIKKAKDECELVANRQKKFIKRD